MKHQTLPIFLSVILCLSILSSREAEGQIPFRFDQIEWNAPSRIQADSDHLIVQSPNAEFLSEKVKAASYFLGEHAYIVPASLAGELEKETPVRWIALKEEWKVHPDLRADARATDLLEVVLAKDISSFRAFAAIEKAGITIEKKRPGAHFVVVKNAGGVVNRLKALREVVFIHTGNRRSEPEDLRSKYFHRSTSIDGNNGLSFDGEGVSALVRDDGFVGPHLDFKGRISNHPELEPNLSSHGDGVAGIIGGAGNIDPDAIGMAPGASLYAIQYEPSFLDNTLDLHIEDDVLYTNSSYSNGCNDGYTPNAAEVDRQMFEFPTLMHIFSAGNSNRLDCDYGAGNLWGNVTGGHKQAKNAIATANVDFRGDIILSSSRGPAADGRLKPDIAANGDANFSTNPFNDYQSFGGTSGAAPCIAGVATQLNHAFRDENGLDIPAALVKAAMLNGARDAGVPGPDYIYGFGLLDAENAFEILQEQQYFASDLQNGQVENFSIPVESPGQRVKIMLYWADPPAAPMASNALVNDLDLKAVWQSDTILPLVKDPTPNPAILEAPAQEGVDRLNNVEQIVIEPNGSGNIEVTVHGHNIPQGPQQFYLVYSYEERVNFTWLSPRPGEKLTPFFRIQTEWSRSDEEPEDKTLSYSLDGGESWVSEDISRTQSRYFFRLQPPIPQDGDSILFAYSDGNLSDTMNRPAYFASPYDSRKITIDQYCRDSAVLRWEAQAGADRYRLYSLGEQEMEVLLETDSTHATVSIDNPTLENLFAISVRYENDRWSDRQRALLYPGGLLDCPEEYDLGISRVEVINDIPLYACSPYPAELETQLKNNGQNPIDSFELCVQFDNRAPECQWVYQRILPGDSLSLQLDSVIIIDTVYDQIQAWCQAENDQFFYNDTMTREYPYEYFFPEDALDSLQVGFDFERFPAGSRIANPDDELTWETRSRISKRLQRESMVNMPFFFYQDVGQVDEFFLPIFHLDSQDVDAELIFEYAYSTLPQSHDSLRILAYSVCDSTVLDTLWENGGPGMATADVGFSRFQPQTHFDWADARISLGHLVGQDLLIGFQAINAYGNDLYIDEIGIIPDSSYLLSHEVQWTPDTVCVGDSVDILTSVDSRLPFATKYVNIEGFTLGRGDSIRWALQDPADTLIGIVSENDYHTRTTGIALQLAPTATLEIRLFEQMEDTAHIAALTRNADSVLWETDQGETFTGDTVRYIAPIAGPIEFFVTAYGGECQPATESFVVDFTRISSLDLPHNPSITLYPNPSSEGRVFANFKGGPSGTVGYEIHDLTGQTVGEGHWETTSNSQQLELKWPASLGAGTYWIRFYNAENQLIAVKQMIRIR